MEGAGVFVCGVCFFPTCFVALKKILEYSFLGCLSNADIVCICVKAVSSIQAILAVVVGYIIMGKCQTDIMKDSYWMTNSYTLFGMPYFIYDLYAMQLEYCCNNPDISEKGVLYGVKHYARNNKAMIIHHLFLPLILFPAILFYRKGLGDFFVGALFQLEIAVPFLGFRNVLVQLNMKNTKLYVYAGVVMIVVFFMSRVMVFPYVYWKYAGYADIPYWTVPFSIPIKCNVACGSILVLQVFWLSKMIKGAVKLYQKLSIESRSPSKVEKLNNHYQPIPVLHQHHIAQGLS